MAKAQFRTELLERILSQPTAPFRERHVIETVSRVLDKARVPYFLDPIGNLVIGVASGKAYRKLLRVRSKEPVRVFVAHMDHPGFHGAEWTASGELKLEGFGRMPTRGLEAARIWLADAKGWAGFARITEAKLSEKPRKAAVESIVARVEGSAAELRKRAPRASELYAGFAFRSPVWHDGALYYTKAADDLVGSFAIVSLAIDFAAKACKGTYPFLGILTRAEEVGWIGAIAHLDLNWTAGAKRPLVYVSLETSRQLPGATIGKGPIVRLGDRYTVFDPAYSRLFTDLAAREMPGRHQRRIMDGGSCEASAVTAYGERSIAISVPLGNYHNQNLEGGPDSIGEAGSNSPAPEFVHQADIQGLLELCHCLMKPKLPWADPFAARLKDLRKELKGYRALLRSGP